MRYIYLFILSLGICASITGATVKDSLLHALTVTSNSQQRLSIYRNLADLRFETDDEKTYLLQLYHEALNINDSKHVIEALGDLTFYESNHSHLDSAYYYLGIIKKKGTNKEVQELSAYFQMRFFDELCFQNKSKEAIEKELNSISTQEGKSNDIYQKIANAYKIGSSFYANEQYQKAIEFYRVALKLSVQLPNPEKHKFRMSIAWKLAYTYSNIGEHKNAILLMKQLMEEQESFYEKYYKNQRPFYNISVRRLQYYSFMMSNVIYLPTQTADAYWEEIVKLGKVLPNPIDRYNYFLSMNNYYMNKRPKPNYHQALIANDSLIALSAKRTPKNLPGLYYINSRIYEVMGDYKNALDHLKTSIQLKDSIASDDIEKQLNELQVKYNLNKVNHEKAQLAIKNKQTVMTLLFAILLISISVCLYLYRTLRKEKAMKIRLKTLHLKAEESEQMKTSFINSMCHEIRTPLNAIVGFSDLLLNEEIDTETRSMFPAEIQKNTHLLTSLIDSLLDASNLDVSKGGLPCESVDISNICHREIKAKRQANPTKIDYQLDTSPEPLMIKTHETYLTKVIEHLLRNATNFTSEGSITLSCHTDKPNKQLKIEVTDTGCGIPKEKQEEVFNRFYKVSDFTPGHGLGLYMCRLIIKRLNGEIRIDPNYTTGTRVIVTLPM